MRTFIMVSASSLVLALVGCEGKPRPAEPSGGASNSARQETPAAPADAKDESSKGVSSHSGHGGAVIELGTTTIAGLTVRVTRDEGEIKPGGEAAVDVWVTAGDGKPAAISAVRMWIGSEDASGALRAKASIEDPKEPERWHTHVEVPGAVSAETRLWVELETPEGTKSSGSFELKQ